VSESSGRLEGLGIDAVHAGATLLLLAALFLYSPLFVQPPGGTFTILEVAVLFVLYTMILVGLNLQFGHTGLVNFGPVAFFAVGGYTAAMLTADDPFRAVGLGLSWPVGLAGAVLAAAALGVLLGVSTLRLRDDFLAIVTLAVAEIVHGLVETQSEITGGGLGLNNVPRPIAGTTSAGDGAVLASTLVVFGALAVLFYGVFRRLSASPYGRVLRAIRADEQVTETLGKRVFRYKLAVFVYGAAVAGLAGALLVFYNGAASPGFFTINVTVVVWIGMLIGGAGSDRGVIGGLAIIMGFQLFTRFLNDQIPFVSQDQFASLRLVLIGLLLMAIVKYRPEGIWGDADQLGVES